MKSLLATLSYFQMMDDTYIKFLYNEMLTSILSKWWFNFFYKEMLTSILHNGMLTC